MSITNKDKAREARANAKKKKELEAKLNNGNPEIASKLITMFDDFHSLDIRDDYAIEREFYQDKLNQMNDDNLRGTWDNDLLTFSPSGLDACERHLAMKLLKFPQDERIMFPYQKRWVNNGSAVHDRVQKDWLYIGKLFPDAPFEMLRTKDGKPAWERNTRTVQQIEHNGQKFQIYGMCDGMIWDKERKKRIGYDFKTKSTTVATVGDYKMKAPQENNVVQMVGYSLLFGVDEYIIHYESVAKDGWLKGAEAKNDMKAFHIVITDEMKTEVLDKLAGIVADIKADAMPNPDFAKCTFCTYKTICSQIEKGEV